MANRKVSPNEPNKNSAEKNIQEIKKTLKQGANSPAVKQALTREKQPVTPTDLSPLHNTREIGTSGGDQRASENEINEEKDRR